MDLTKALRREARFHRCSVCGENMAGCEIHILEQREHVALVRVVCPSCHDESHYQILFRTGGAGAGEAAVVRPSRAEIEGAPAAFGEPVSSDEMLDVRQALAGYHGDLRSLVEASS